MREGSPLKAVQARVYMLICSSQLSDEAHDAIFEIFILRVRHIRQSPSPHRRAHRSVVIILTLMPYGENGDRVLVFNLKQRDIAGIAERDDKLS